ncbi:MAG: TorF family putative porin [Candidatus Andeanibacterium colombiense]|uniref:TorF family putative porin n=1 Tax=Candidatus Andeanibacterium colombiense TaxID=3121345 RepID=A0AAJ5X463_9SPHN|nr:MAG: TorF family putative porin [Sphingomonadaceae bacterium]
MLTSVRSLMAATILAGTVLAAAPAFAEDEATPDLKVTGNVTLATQYRFRGVGLSDGDIAIQGGLTLNTKPGFYVGTWASSLEDTPQYGEVELDIFGGWAGQLTDSIGIDVGALYYAYPSANHKADCIGPCPADVIEFYGKVKPTIGPVGLTLGVAYMPKQDSLGSDDNLYLSADAALAIPSTPISLSGHVGYTDGGLAYYLTTNSKAFDWSVGASATVLGGLTLGVSYIGVEHDGPAVDGVTDDAIVGTLGFSF